MRCVRWWLLAGGVACLAAAGLLLAGWLAVQAYGPTLTRERLEAALTEAAGGPVRIVRVRLWNRGRSCRINLSPGATSTRPEGSGKKNAGAGYRVGTMTASDSPRVMGSPASGLRVPAARRGFMPYPPLPAQW